MEIYDLPMAIEVQRQTFSEDLRESLDVFHNRFNKFGDHFFVMTENDQIIGYVLAFPWVLGDSPVNNEFFPEILELPTCYYVHDIAILPKSQGKGLAKMLFERVSDQALKLGFSNISLISVLQSADYWDRFGFKELDVSEEKQVAILQSYGKGARLMIKAISSYK